LVIEYAFEACDADGARRGFFDAYPTKELAERAAVDYLSDRSGWAAAILRRDNRKSQIGATWTEVGSVESRA
jgi:hypothetical protein